MISMQILAIYSFGGRVLCTPYSYDSFIGKLCNFRSLRKRSGVSPSFTIRRIGIYMSEMIYKTLKRCQKHFRNIFKVELSQIQVLKYGQGICDLCNAYSHQVWMKDEQNFQHIVEVWRTPCWSLFSLLMSILAEKSLNYIGRQTRVNSFHILILVPSMLNKTVSQSSPKVQRRTNLSKSKDYMWIRSIFSMRVVRHRLLCF